MLEQLEREAERLGKEAWRPMLRYVAALHGRSVHPPRPPFSRPWEEIGPGYCYAPAFGHWDLVHQILDVLPAEPDHARDQILNDLENQQEDGLVPGSIWMRDAEPRFSTTVSHPPVWVVAVNDYCEQVGNDDLIRTVFHPLIRQIGWFEEHRKAEDEGYYYTDIVNHKWESGIDEGVRFDDAPTGRLACVDATSHVCLLYDVAADWERRLGGPATAFAERAAELRLFISERMFDQETGLFHDIWAVGNPDLRRLAIEGMFPLVAGAASEEQAERVIEENLLNPERFFAPHPVTSVGLSDPRYSLRMWRGPTWNSMTMWAARGCLVYERPDAAHRLAEAALDAAARVFERTGTVWEFYHPQGEDPTTLERKPQTPFNAPCPDYLGHNPLLALARIWEATA